MWACWRKVGEILYGDPYDIAEIEIQKYKLSSLQKRLIMSDANKDFNPEDFRVITIFPDHTMQ